MRDRGLRSIGPVPQDRQPLRAKYYVLYILTDTGIGLPRTECGRSANECPALRGPVLQVYPGPTVKANVLLRSADLMHLHTVGCIHVTTTNQQVADVISVHYRGIV